MYAGYNPWTDILIILVMILVMVVIFMAYRIKKLNDENRKYRSRLRRVDYYWYHENR